ncbi:MAG: hypothetical protein IJW44_00315, partial [Clostridia bacterium]|nr:hypothetical protein [Clostridia bacterium]
MTLVQIFPIRFSPYPGYAQTKKKKRRLLSQTSVVQTNPIVHMCGVLRLEGFLREEGIRRNRKRFRPFL